MISNDLANIIVIQIMSKLHAGTAFAEFKY